MRAHGRVTEMRGGISAPDVHVDDRHADKLVELAVVVHAAPLVRDDPLHHVHCSHRMSASAMHHLEGGAAGDRKRQHRVCLSMCSVRLLPDLQFVSVCDLAMCRVRQSIVPRAADTRAFDACQFCSVLSADLAWTRCRGRPQRGVRR